MQATESTLRRYAEFRPTGCDSRGLGLDNQQDWLVAPVCRTRDSGPLEQSNFAAALEQLGGESETVEVHRFGHWGPGWFDIVIVNPSDTARVSIAEGISRRLEDYPILDEEDFSERESDEFADSWNNWGCAEYRRNLIRDFGLSEATEERLDEIDDESLCELYTAHTSEAYVSESSGVSIPADTGSLTRDELAAFLREHK